VTCYEVIESSARDVDATADSYRVLMLEQNCQHVVELSCKAGYRCFVMASSRPIVDMDIVDAVDAEEDRKKVGATWWAAYPRTPSPFECACLALCQQPSPAQRNSTQHNNCCSSSKVQLYCRGMFCSLESHNNSVN
jgi:hypothetical protein